MTGTFARSARTGECVSERCSAVIQAGEMAYLWHGLERQTVCLACAKSRWGYEPSNVPIVAPERPERATLGFDSTRAILKKLQQANAHDPKWKQAGGDR
jgi:hypothetical protein